MTLQLSHLSHRSCNNSRQFPFKKRISQLDAEIKTSSSERKKILESKEKKGITRYKISYMENSKIKIETKLVPLSDLKKVQGDEIKARIQYHKERGFDKEAAKIIEARKKYFSKKSAYISRENRFAKVYFHSSPPKKSVYDTQNFAQTKLKRVQTHHNLKHFGQGRLKSTAELKMDKPSSVRINVSQQSSSSTISEMPRRHYVNRTNVANIDNNENIPEVRSSSVCQPTLKNLACCLGVIASISLPVTLFAFLATDQY